MFQMLLSKENYCIVRKKILNIFSIFSFLTKLFFIFLKSSETHFDQVASKIGEKPNNFGHFMAIYHTVLRYLNDHNSKTSNLHIIHIFRANINISGGGGVLTRTNRQLGIAPNM